MIRIAIAVPSDADYIVTSVNNPYACNETNVISQYRRPLPATNLPFLSMVMWDGRESTPLTGTTKTLFNNYPTSLGATWRTNRWTPRSGTHRETGPGPLRPSSSRL